MPGCDFEIRPLVCGIAGGEELCLDSCMIFENAVRDMRNWEHGCRAIKPSWIIKKGKIFHELGLSQ